VENQESIAAGSVPARHETVGGAVAGDGPAGEAGQVAGEFGDRRRLDLALTTARLNAAPETAVAARRGVPGLRKELFPAATWRRELESLHDREQDRAARLQAQEEARVAIGLAEVRAEEILRQARAQARRLVNTASTVARARQEHAERLAAAKMADAEAEAAATVSAARQAEEIPTDSGVDMQALYGRLVQMQSALRDAEVRLDAFAAATRADIAAHGDVVDPDALSVEPGEGVAAHYATYGPPVPRLRPKSRFEVPGLTPERIEALRDEFSR
jgi:hypothetical protein